MITNALLRLKKDNLKNEKAKLVKQKQELESIIKASGISRNAVRYIPQKLDERSLMARNNAVNEKMELEKELVKINELLKEVYSLEDSEKNKKLTEIFKEIFNEVQLKEITNECERRMKGESPLKLNYRWDDFEKYKSEREKYKKLASEYLNKSIELRIILTGLIEDGCKQFGNANFLKFISPVNKLIIPLEELKKIKIKNFL